MKLVVRKVKRDIDKRHPLFYTLSEAEQKENKIHCWDCVLEGKRLFSLTEGKAYDLWKRGFIRLVSHQNVYELTDDSAVAFLRKVQRGTPINHLLWPREDLGQHNNYKIPWDKEFLDAYIEEITQPA